MLKCKFFLNFVIILRIMVFLSTVLLICIYWPSMNAEPRQNNNDFTSKQHSATMAPRKQSNTSTVSVPVNQLLFITDQQITRSIAGMRNSLGYYNNQQQPKLSAHLNDKSPSSPPFGISDRTLPQLQLQQFSPQMHRNLSFGIQPVTIQPWLNSLKNITKGQIHRPQESSTQNRNSDFFRNKKFDQLFPFFSTDQSTDSTLPVAEKRLKKCCSRLNEADPECKKRFCGFDALEPRTVSVPIKILISQPLCYKYKTYKWAGDNHESRDFTLSLTAHYRFFILMRVVKVQDRK